MQVPLGPVAVLGASNFPFAFGALGNDTGSALAAGCPVVAKAHPAHPETQRAPRDGRHHALAAAGAPEGAFGLVAGFEAGEDLVRRAPRSPPWRSPVPSAAAWRCGDSPTERSVVIPVYAEMGTVNPVVMTTACGGSDGGDRRRVRRLLHPRRRPVLHQAGAPARSRRVRRPGPRRGRTAERAADRLAAHRGHRRRLRIRGRRAGRCRGRGARPGAGSGRGLVRGRHRTGRARRRPEAGLTAPRGVLRPGRAGGRVRRSPRAHRGAGGAAGCAGRQRDVGGSRGPRDAGPGGCADSAGRPGRGGRLADRGRLHVGPAARWTVAGHDLPVRHVGRAPPRSTASPGR